MKEIAKLKRTGKNDRDVVFRMVRIICAIWQTHPFREGNTRSIIVFAVLLAKHLRFEADHELFRVNSSYVRNALVWGAQGIYSKHMMMWIVITFVSFFMAYICWYAKGEGIIALSISSIIIGVLLAQAFNLNISQGFYMYDLLEVLTWIVAVFLLRRKPKEYAKMMCRLLFQHSL